MPIEKEPSPQPLLLLFSFLSLSYIVDVQYRKDVEEDEHKILILAVSF